MSEFIRWRPERYPWKRSCAECQADPEKQVLPGHDACLPPISGRHTADCVPVTVGLRVWDYDLREGTVIEVDHSFQGTPDGPLGIVAWHLVQRDDGVSVGMFDGSRICTTHPVTGERPKQCCRAPDGMCDGTVMGRPAACGKKLVHDPHIHGTAHMYTECPERAPVNITD